ncbi:sigma-54-dependent transcriptional regulator [Dethiosulfatarculus sandiegensis]|uniref:DNA-binding transcriptional regulator NtrC n=1 Tax=Dethiosulfatarculus sandiegensis TaxID=1429043 RepID=A0A0D2HZ97_9BACT|nr:sigma-54 dependent transcriptional regulator [Dethiosulfatarculus sandiegensis]KIX15573.1 Fis family transcriptional regulator [Dethiosulfatarculus sandiegensis]
MARILVVDPDDRSQKKLERLLFDHGHRVFTTDSGESAAEMMAERRFDLVIMAQNLPGKKGLSAFDDLHRMDPKLPVIITSRHGTTDEAIEAAKLGVFDYVLTPIPQKEILNLTRQALEAGEFSRTQVSMDQGPASLNQVALVGRSKPMQEIYKSIGRAAPTDATVLVRGESGTGKELVARALYQHSTREGRPFMVVNCVAIPETLLESELFGYEKGAFTGATTRRLGKMEHASGGTVFLDEIGDMPSGIQAKILRLLQDRTIERLGGQNPIPVDVRIIAATNRDLETAMKEGRFREDLYYRLNVVSINLPPLRKRPDDIPILSEYFLARFSASLGVRNPGITKDAVALLCGHSWPGNVRELANVLEKCLIFSQGRTIGEEDVKGLALGDPAGKGVPVGCDEAVRNWARWSMAAGEGNLLTQMTDHVGKLIVAEALKITGGNRTKASKLLGVSRPTLLAKMSKYGLRDETYVIMD